MIFNLFDIYVEVNYCVVGDSNYNLSKENKLLFKFIYFVANGL